MKKILGYLISLLALAALASTSIPKLKAQLKIPATIIGLPLTNTIITIISIIVLALGIFIVLTSKKSSSTTTKKDLPIYEGEKIVGFRRHSQ